MGCFSSILTVLIGANVLAFAALSYQEGQRAALAVEYSAHRALLQSDTASSDAYSLNDIRVLVAVAAFDFSQLPHLEEVLDGYHDTCVSGAIVHVVLHTTVAWPVPLLDLLQTRFPCPRFRLEFILKLPRVKLHLVDFHRQLFYDRLQDYDLFIYTEDDIRVTPSTIATYLEETHRVARLIAGTQYTPSDFNVGIVRYEYNFPSNVVMDDRTRKVTENVTRVYWEHSSFQPPLVPNAVEGVPQEPLASQYVHMKNHHQGMYLATRELLQAWKGRCQFQVASLRPARRNAPSQPLFGTQRVWMSSQQLYGNKFGCKVQQVIPLDRFGALTVHHLPNKNYRRVGKYRTRDTNRDEGVVVEQDQLLTAMQLHLALAREFPSTIPRTVRIQMYPDIPDQHPPDPSWKAKLDAFDAYIRRGGILSPEDMLESPL